MRVRHPKAVTEWERPDLMLPSQYGTITYRNWCQKEVERMNSKESRGGQARILSLMRGYGGTEIIAIAR